MSLTSALAKAQLRVKVGSLYYHYKDKKKYYRLDRLAINEADQKVIIVYTSCDHQEITWTRPLDSWLEVVDGVQRFNLLE